MKKRLATILLSSSLLLTYTFTAFADSNATATTATIEDAQLTSDDLQAAAEVYKYTGGNDTDETRLRLFRFSTAAAALGNAKCILYLGELYQGMNVSGVDGDEAINKAIEWWNSAGENGEPSGYTDIGLLYLHTTVPGGSDAYGSIEYDPQTALQYLEKANEMNDIKAPRYIGNCYRDGIGVTADEEKAYQYYELAADRGDSTSIVNCAEYLLEGKGVEQNIDKALSLYQGIIDSDGHDTPKAAYILGSMYETGEYVEQNLEKAREYYQITVDKAFSADMQESLDLAQEGLKRLS